MGHTLITINSGAYSLLLLPKYRQLIQSQLFGGPQFRSLKIAGSNCQADMFFSLLGAILLVSRALTSPVEVSRTIGTALQPRAVDEILSYIALGESYASGVGAGTSDRSVLRSRCLRFDKAYPRVLARDSGLPGPSDETRLINNACSGSKINEVLEKQFQDTDSGDFKAFGEPRFATISAAGDDVEFKELVLSCIYEFPTKPSLCQDQIDKSQSIIDSPAFFLSIQELIKTTLDKGLVNHNDFRIYYLGYGQFFNIEETTPDFCSQKTWSLCKFWQRGCEKLPLDVPLRTKLNTLAVNLNFQVQAAVDSFKDTA